MQQRESYLQTQGSCFSLGSFAISPAVEILLQLKNAVDSSQPLSLFHSEHTAGVRVAVGELFSTKLGLKTSKP